MDNKITIPQGDSGTIALDVTYTSGAAVDLSAYTDTKLSVKKGKDKTTYILQLTGTITATPGMATYAYTHAQTKGITPGNYVCDVRFWNTSTKAVTTVMNVQFVIDWPVYDTLDIA